MHLTIHLLFETKIDLKISNKDLLKFFQFATYQSSVIFNRNMYDKTDGIVMGQALPLILANIFMGYHKKEWIRYYNYGVLLYYNLL